MGGLPTKGATMATTIWTTRSSSTTASGMVSFYGTSTPGASVTVTVGERTVTALTYSSGMWFAPPVQVDPGSQTIYMTASSVDFTSPTVRTVRYFEGAREQPAWQAGPCLLRGFGSG